jgi:molybdate transport system ATP-binding protein
VAGHLIASFRKAHSATVDVQADFELESGGGRIMALFGPSGSGKTTILRCLAGLERPQHGFIRFDAETWFDSEKHVHIPPQQRQLGYVSQEFGLFPHLTVEQNIRFGMPPDGSADSSRRGDELLERVHLAAMAERLPSQLSGGERQRVALARVLARNPRLILLDEPLAALDLPLRDPIRHELRTFLRSIDVPSVIVTHDRVDALAIADRMSVLSGGRIRQIGSVHEVFSRPVDVTVAASVGVETVVPGEVISLAEGVATVRAGDAQVRAVHAGSVGAPVFVCIRAEDVTLESSLHEGTSARNRWTGRVTTVQHEGAVVRVTIDCGFLLTALLTRPAQEELRVATGETIAAVVKATAVHLIAR